MSNSTKSRVAFGAPPLKASSERPRSGGPCPALSIPAKIPPLDPILERLKRKTIRRNAPEGEDLKKIREIIKGLHNEVITVQEFVGLISPYTGDNGHILRTVMGSDLSSFRKMAKHVYETMTQDVSDVLANEQIHLTEYYKERYTLYMDKMMRTIDDIYRHAPNFDFELYYEDPEEYLKKLFPINLKAPIGEEDETIQCRQEAYHRLQWLRSEGDRLVAENKQLQTRLKELKSQQQQELMNVQKREEMAELRKAHLEATQADLQNQLQEIQESVERSMVLTEEEMRQAEDADLKGRHSRREIQRTKLQAAKAPPPRGEPWNVRTAKKIEQEALTQSATAAISNISIASTMSRSSRKTKQVKIKRPPLQPRDRPQSQPRQVPQAQAKQLPAARAPRDSWDGLK